ncbi:MAG: SUMF1/EgtB/PvdO family nonheme iron enzyme, partial [Saprospiraceae bacterium]|nr:SUMF1/EgtB/PvdO family nonheme iron enzyme [Saprospiraceae bacterium]
WDWFNKSWYAQSEGAADPRGPDFGHFRICRGGSFNMPPAFCRAANRSWGAPYDRGSFTGFRVARSGE